MIEQNYQNLQLLQFLIALAVFKFLCTIGQTEVIRQIKNLFYFQ